jgi:hypothetical protein
VIVARELVFLPYPAMWLNYKPSVTRRELNHENCRIAETGTNMFFYRIACVLAKMRFRIFTRFGFSVLTLPQNPATGGQRDVRGEVFKNTYFCTDFRYGIVCLRCR